MKVIHLPDPHCYYTVYESIDKETGKSVRLLEWERLAEYIVRKAREIAPDLIIVPGDFFRNARPEHDQIFMVAEFMKGLETSGADVVGFLGNHDTRPQGKKTPVDVFSAIGRNPRWNIATPQVVHGGKYDLAILPSVHASQIFSREIDPAEAAQKISDHLVTVMKSLRNNCREDVTKILAGHWVISGAKASSGQTLLADREPVIPLEEILSCGWDLACFGHIHKPQVLSKSPFVGYAGAMQRINIGEEKDDRGFWVHDTDSGESEWVPIPALEFLTITLEQEEARRVCTDPDLFQDVLNRFPTEGKFVRIRYEVTEEEAAKIRPDILASMVMGRGALAVVDVKADIIRNNRARNSAVTEQTSVLEALDMWLNDRDDVSDDLKDRVRRIASDTFAEILRQDDSGEVGE